MPGSRSKRGVIYAHQAQAIVKKREEDEAQKRMESAERKVEKLKKDAIRECKKKWKLIFQELKRSIRQQKKNSYGGVWVG